MTKKEIIQNNIKQILSRIEQACENSNRNPSDVKLLLATKTVSANNIKIALETGQKLIGENKAQELKDKYEDLKSFSPINHFIGHLQSNKIKDILKYDVTCVQSIDRLDLAEKLQKRLEFEKRTIDIFIQVNTSNESSKFGIKPENAIEFSKQLSQLENLKVKGLMTIGLFDAEEEKVRACFKKLKTLQQTIDQLTIPNVTISELSMGMSGDLEIAIEEGATIVRVGTAIFGDRIYPDSYYWNERQ